MGKPKIRVKILHNAKKEKRKVLRCQFAQKLWKPLESQKYL